MSKELIIQLRDLANLRHDDMSIGDEAADALEAQQSWIASLEQNARDADRMYKELEGELAASQAQIKVLLEALESIGNGFHESHQVHAVIKHALAQPTDDLALRELLKAGYEAQLNVMREALENCRLIAARYRKEEWAQHALRICADAGVNGSVLRQDDDDSALRELLKAERERCILELHRNADKPIDEIVSAIRAMGSESPKLICPRCGVDRFKVPCPGPFHMCPIRGEAQ